MTQDPRITSSSNSAASPGEVPPYQQGTTPGVPPYQEYTGPGAPNAGPFGAADAGWSAQSGSAQGAPGSYYEQSGPHGPGGAQGAGPFGSDNVYQQAPFAGPSSVAPAEERTWSILSHVAGVAGFILSVGWLGFLGPLVIYLIYKDRSPRIRASAAGAFNFAVSLLIANAAAFLLLITVIGIPISILLWIGALVGLFVCHIMAAIKAANDEPYTYPFQIKILK